MGILFRVLFIPNTNMKVIILVTLFMPFIQALDSTSGLMSKEEANSKLVLPDGRTRRAAIGIFKKSVSKVQRRWNSYCKFNTVEKWNEFKDDVEETNLPEKEVDNLEKCTFWCARSDEAKDFAGNAYEEKREDQEEKGTAFVAACPQCFAKVPKSGNFKFPKTLKNGKPCKNSKAGMFGK